jgi:hypothetical protein
MVVSPAPTPAIRHSLFAIRRRPEGNVGEQSVETAVALILRDTQEIKTHLATLNGTVANLQAWQNSHEVVHATAAGLARGREETTARFSRGTWAALSALVSAAGVIAGVLAKALG